MAQRLTTACVCLHPSFPPDCCCCGCHVLPLLQALGQQSEYMRATTTTTTAGGGDKGGSGSGGSGDNSKSEVSKLIAEKQALYRELDAEKAKAEAAAKDLSAVKEQAKVGVRVECVSVVCKQVVFRHL